MKNIYDANFSFKKKNDANLKPKFYDRVVTNLISD